MADFEEVARQSTQQLQNFTTAIGKSTLSINSFIDSFGKVSAGIGALGFLAGGPLGAAPGALGAAGAGIAGMGATLAGTASPNGLDSVNKSFEILSGTIGSMLLPGVVALGGVAMVASASVARFVKEHRSDIIKFWTQSIINSAQFVDKFTQAVKDFVDFLGNLNLSGAIREKNEADAKGEQLEKDRIAILNRREILEGKTQFAQDALKHFPERAKEMVAEGDAALARGRAAQPVGEAKKEEEGKQIEANIAGFLEKLADAMDSVSKDMQASLAQSGMTDPVSKWKEVAVAVQKSDLEIKRMSMWTDSMVLVKDLISEIRRLAAGPKVAAVGGGWWE